MHGGELRQDYMHCCDPESSYHHRSCILGREKILAGISELSATHPTAGTCWKDDGGTFRKALTLHTRTRDPLPSVLSFIVFSLMYASFILREYGRVIRSEVSVSE